MNRRGSLLREAERHAAWLRASGYPAAEVAPEYCIHDIGPDNFYTYTISVYAGQRTAQPDAVSVWRRLAARLRRAG